MAVDSQTLALERMAAWSLVGMFLSIAQLEVVLQSGAPDSMFDRCGFPAGLQGNARNVSGACVTPPIDAGGGGALATAQALRAACTLSTAALLFWLVRLYRAKVLRRKIVDQLPKHATILSSSSLVRAVAAAPWRRERDARSELPSLSRPHS